MQKFMLNVALVACVGLAVMIALSMWHTATVKSALAVGGTAFMLNGPMGPDTGYSVMGNPTITASSIDRIHCSAKSPACGTGPALYTGGVVTGIDPIYALAFFQHESSFGLAGVARATLGLGNIRCSQGYRCIDGFRAYGSWQAGYEDWYRLIRYYVTAWHKATLDQIIPTYAPSSENDTRGYIEAIKSAVSTWRTSL